MGNVSMSKEWNDIHEGREWGKYPSETVIRFVARTFRDCDRSKVKILDFGCGQGANTWYLAREGFDVYAFDGSKAAVDKAREFLERENLTASFDVMDGLNISYPENYFDAIIDNACICNNRVQDIKAMYGHIYNCLKSGGKLYTSLFSVKTTGYGTGERIEDGTYKNISCGRLEGVGIVHFWQRDELIKAVESCGFKEVEIDEYSYTDLGSYVDIYILRAMK